MAKKYQGTLQTEILMRALGEDGFKDVYEQYKEARHRFVAPPVPTDKEIRIANLVREHGYKGAASKVGIPVESVYTILGRVSKYKFLTK